MFSLDVASFACSSCTHMIQFRHINQAREELEIGAFIIKLPQILMLMIIPSPKRLQRIHRVRPSMHRAQHGRQEFVYAIRFLDERDERGDSAFVVG